MFILAGLGMNIEEIPCSVLEVIKKADYVFLEIYTNIPSKKLLEYLMNLRKDIKIVYRKFVEEELEDFIIKNKEKTIALLVFGNPLFATTHISLLKFCKENKIDFKVILSSSIYDHIAKTGLFIYKFGKTVSIPFHESDIPYKVIKENLSIGAHTLLLLDIDTEKSKYLSIREAIERLISLENKFREGIIDLNKKIIICERLGFEDEKIYYVSLKKAMEFEYNYPVCIIYPSDLNPIEKEILKCMSYFYEE